MAVNSPNAKAATIMGIMPMAAEMNVAWPAVAATELTENMAVPDTTSPTAAP